MRLRSVLATVAATGHRGATAIADRAELPLARRRRRAAARRVGGPPPPGLPPAVEVATDVGVLLLPAHDRVITPHVVAHGRYEPAERRLIERAVRPGGTVLDVGANVGCTVLAAARRVGPHGRVVAVEPHPDTVALLRANVARNGHGDVVRVVAAAAWSRAGRLPLGESPLSTGDHRVGAAATRGRSTLEVDAVRLDDLVGDLPPVGLVKLDVQATEHHALAGARGLLARDRPLVLAELWPRGIRERGEDPLDVLAAYRELGLSWTVVGRPRRAALDDRATVALVDALPGDHGGFATLRMRPGGPAR